MRAPRWGILLALVTSVAWAEAAGVLDHLKGGGKLVIGHRESSLPFSYVDPKSGKPMGYALDICLRLAQSLRKQLNLKDLPVELVAVTPANRIDLVEQGKVHLECGSTTNNAERRKRVAFTVPHFITGARLMVRADSTVERIEDLGGKRLVSTRGTTPLKVVDQNNRERLMRIQILEAPDHARAVEMVEKGEADAFAMDDVLLYGLIASRPNPAALKVVGKFLTTEPLAIMLTPGDAAFKKLIDDEMRRMVLEREIHPIYDKWFMKPIPPAGASLNLPISYLLRDFWKYPTDQVPF